MTIAIHLPRETDQRLEVLASRTGRTKADYVREFIERGLDDADDYDLAATVLERVRTGEERVHSATSVRKDLDLDGAARRDDLIPPLIFHHPRRVLMDRDVGPREFGPETGLDLITDRMGTAERLVVGQFDVELNHRDVPGATGA